MKILVLHGGGMNGPGMKEMISNLADALGPLVEFHYPTAPNPKDSNERLWMGDPEKQNDPNALSWWRKDTLPYLESFVAEHDHKRDPFDGVLGYSMGCSAAFSLLAEPKFHGKFRFAVLCCGFVPTNNPDIMANLEQARPIQTPALHVQGRTDPVIPNDFSDGMREYFAPDKVELCKHPGGHHQPYNTTHVNQIASFLLKHIPPSIYNPPFNGAFPAGTSVTNCQRGRGGPRPVG